MKGHWRIYHHDGSSFDLSYGIGWSGPKDGYFDLHHPKIEGLYGKITSCSVRMILWIPNKEETHVD